MNKERNCTVHVPSSNGCLMILKRTASTLVVSSMGSKADMSSTDLERYGLHSVDVPSGVYNAPTSR